MRAGPSDGGIARAVSPAKSGPQASPLGPAPSGALGGLLGEGYTPLNMRLGLGWRY
jgi:hypothetical protein